MKWNDYKKFTPSSDGIYLVMTNFYCKNKKKLIIDICTAVYNKSRQNWVFTRKPTPQGFSILYWSFIEKEDLPNNIFIKYDEELKNEMD